MRLTEEEKDEIRSWNDSILAFKTYCEAGFNYVSVVGEFKVAIDIIPSNVEFDYFEPYMELEDLLTKEYRYFSATKFIQGEPSNKESKTITKRA